MNCPQCNEIAGYKGYKYLDTKTLKSMIDELIYQFHDIADVMPLPRTGTKYHAAVEKMGKLIAEIEELHSVSKHARDETPRHGETVSIARCPECNWPLAKTVAEGCVIGNCSYRPHGKGG